MTLQVAFIGTGSDPNDPDREGFAMAYRHANAYRKIDDCRLAACADIVPENARAFADHFGLSDDDVYEDYQSMVEEVRPDVISVCVPPKVHAAAVIDCAETGIPEAIHCEKPMAAEWGECREMAAVCERNDVQLTINHQRRFGAPFRKAKELLETGAIGELSRIEFAEENLYDAGTHLFDLCGYYTNQAEAEWLLGAIDYREENVWFGSHNENHGFAQWRYENGVHALASTGVGSEFVGCYLRLRGTEGTVEIGVPDGPALRVKRADSGSWTTVDTNGEDVHGPSSPGLLKAAVRKVSRSIRGDSKPRTQSSYIDRAIADAVRAVRDGGTSELDARNALQAAELIFACWESARRRGRVEFPLEIDDNPLEAMVEAGQLGLGRAEAENAPEPDPSSASEPNPGSESASESSSESTSESSSESDADSTRVAQS